MLVAYPRTMKIDLVRSGWLSTIAKVDEPDFYVANYTT